MRRPRAIMSPSRAAICILALGLAALVYPATATAQEPRLDITPGSFLAKTHPSVPFEQSAGSQPPNQRSADLAGLEAAPSITRAGAHPDATTSFSLETPAGLNGPFPRDIEVKLPAGFVGNPTAAIECSRARFTMEPPSGGPGSLYGGLCPPGSQVGVADLDVRGGAVTAGGYPIYRITPSFGSPAAFGMRVIGQAIVLEPRLRSESDYGITVTSPNIPNQPVRLHGATVTVWGVPADGHRPGDGHFDDRLDNTAGDGSGEWGVQPGIERRPFWINPTRCDQGELDVDISMRAWYAPDRWLPRDLEPGDVSSPSDYVATSPPVTGCDQMAPFDPELEMRPASSRAGQPSGYEASLQVPYNHDPDGVAVPFLKKAEVKLPDGVTVSPSSAHGLTACTDSQAGFGTEHRMDCPDSSKIATVEVETPLLDEAIPGSVHIASPRPDQLLRLFILLRHERYGVTVRVAGDVHTDPETGQITAVFDENPELPFTDMDIAFDSGAMASLVNPSECGTHEVVTTLTAWNGDQHVSRSEFEIDRGQCATPPPFDPWLKGDTTDGVAGSFTDYFVRFGRFDSHQMIDSIDLDLPEGLVAKIAGVPQCSDAAADRGTCGPGSRIGHLQIASGAGDRPYWVPGPGKDATSVHLAGPYRGAPYSLSIVAPAQAGPFDLGRVVVRSPIHVDDRTTELSIDVAQSRVFDRFGRLAQVMEGRMPSVLEGIPLRIKEVRVIVDREDFMVNPTNCRMQQIVGEIGAIDGRSSTAQSPFRATDCAALDFAPRFGMRIMNPGRRSTLRSFNPRMRFSVAPREGHANIGRAAVTLPRSIILDQSNIRTVCTRPEFAARNCPDAAIYGWARAFSPLLDEPLTGPVFLGSSPNPLPDLIADLQGDVRVILQGQIVGTRDGRMRNIFPSIPDVPVEFFQLEMFGGQNRGVLVNSTDLCRSANRGVANFGGQNGKRDVTRPRVGMAFRGCRQIRQRIAQRHAQRRAAIRQALRQGRITPAQARRAIRR